MEGSPARAAWAWFLGAGLLYALLTAAAFAPAGWWGAAIAAPVPLVWAMRRAGAGGGKAGALVALGALPLWGFEQWWVTQASAAGYVPLVVALSLLTGLTVVVGGRMLGWRAGLPLTVAAPVAWVGVEFLRGRILFTGYPWLLASHPLIDAPALASPGACVGAFGVSFLLVAGIGAAFDALAPRGRRAWGVAGLSATAAWIALTPLAPSAAAGGVVRVGIVQTNVPQYIKMDWTAEQADALWDRLVALTRAAASERPHAEPLDLIVWPETMFPGESLEPIAVPAAEGERLVPATRYAEEIAALQREVGVPIVVGALGIEGWRIVEGAGDGSVAVAWDRRHNSAYLVGGGGGGVGGVGGVGGGGEDGAGSGDGSSRPGLPRYDKLHLTPFGETMPYVNRWRWLVRALSRLGAQQMAFDLAPGRGPVVLEVPGGPGGTGFAVATPICFEAIVSSVCRRLVFEGARGGWGGWGVGGVRRRAGLLVNLTNDGWFGDCDATREQHLQIARWRCLELGTPMARAANTGVSAIVDSRGRVVSAGVGAGANGGERASRGRVRVDGVVWGTVALGAGSTVYARVGDAVGWVSLAAAGAAVVLGAARGRGRARTDGR